MQDNKFAHADTGACGHTLNSGPNSAPENPFSIGASGTNMLGTTGDISGRGTEKSFSESKGSSDASEKKASKSDKPKGGGSGKGEVMPYF